MKYINRPIIFYDVYYYNIIKTAHRLVSRRCDPRGYRWNSTEINWKQKSRKNNNTISQLVLFSRIYTTRRRSQKPNKKHAAFSSLPQKILVLRYCIVRYPAHRHLRNPCSIPNSKYAHCNLFGVFTAGVELKLLRDR